MQSGAAAKSHKTLHDHCRCHHLMHKSFVHEYCNLLAGLNAARRAQELATVVCPREGSYLGTLVDDLVTKVSRAVLHVECVCIAVSS